MRSKDDFDEPIVVEVCKIKIDSTRIHQYKLAGLFDGIFTPGPSLLGDLAQETKDSVEALMNTGIFSNVTAEIKPAEKFYTQPGMQPILKNSIMLFRPNNWEDRSAKKHKRLSSSKRIFDILNININSTSLLNSINPFKQSYSKNSFGDKLISEILPNNDDEVNDIEGLTEKITSENNQHHDNIKNLNFTNNSNLLSDDQEKNIVIPVGVRYKVTEVLPKATAGVHINDKSKLEWQADCNLYSVFGGCESLAFNLRRNLTESLGLYTGLASAVITFPIYPGRQYAPLNSNITLSVVAERERHYARTSALVTQKRIFVKWQGSGNLETSKHSRYPAILDLLQFSQLRTVLNNAHSYLVDKIIQLPNNTGNHYDLQVTAETSEIQWADIPDFFIHSIASPSLAAFTCIKAHIYSHGEERHLMQTVSSSFQAKIGYSANVLPWSIISGSFICSRVWGRIGCQGFLSGGIGLNSRQAPLTERFFIGGSVGQSIHQHKCIQPEDLERSKVGPVGVSKFINSEIELSYALFPESSLNPYAYIYTAGTLVNSVLTTSAGTGMAVRTSAVTLRAEHGLFRNDGKSLSYGFGLRASIGG